MADLTLATEKGAIDVSLTTAADLSSKQYHFVKLDSSEEVVICTANDAPLGILQNAPDGSSTDKTAIVRVQGISKLDINETVAFGDRLTPTSSGNGEIVDAAGEEFGARALTSGDANDHISVQLAFGKIHSSDA